MEDDNPKKKKKKKKKKRSREENGSPSSPNEITSDHHHLLITPLLLAAFVNIHTPYAQSIIKTLTNAHLHLIQQISLLQQNPHSLHRILPVGVLSLLPFLLNSKNPKIAQNSAEIVGAAALFSYEANERIASEKCIVDGLVAGLSNRNDRVVTAVVNAVLDLSTTSIGRDRLLDSSATEKLLSLFCQVATSLLETVSPCSLKKGSSNCSRIGLKEVELPVLILDAMLTLINTCNLEHLAKIPMELAITSMFYLKEMWAKLKGSMLLSKVSDYQQRNYVLSNIKINNLAETIFRLSMNNDHHKTYTSDAIKKSIFGSVEFDFEHFMLNRWEDSPFLFRRVSKILDEDYDVLSALIQSFKGITGDVILDSLLRGLISCPPVASDELDILNFLKQARGGLGCPIVYGQDIRVVKTVDLISGSTRANLKKEVHFVKDCADSDSNEIKSSDFIDIDHVQKCLEAYQKGYTIALRGIEFRSENVAAIADGLAKLFGLPSVGANIYLTPPRSQGLARHIDDHCVFVCQLFGQKQWAVFPRPTSLLPRLYEPRNSLLGSDENIDVCEGKQFLLRERDILYIPRGYPHEAHTVTDDNESLNDDSNGFSLHLTLGIEVEPPFEWEGFAHVALHCWNQAQKRRSHHLIASTSTLLSSLSVNLLHVAIKLIGDQDSTFRKGCLVTAFSLPSDTRDEQHWHTLNLNQRATFNYIINRINSDSSFLDAIKSVEVAMLEKNEDPLQWMGWLQQIPQEGDINENTDLNNPLTTFEDLILLCNNGHHEEAETAFTWVKSVFCREVEFEDVCKRFQMLLEKYKTTRKQYMNGMLSLHCTSG